MTVLKRNIVIYINQIRKNPSRIFEVKNIKIEEELEIKAYFIVKSYTSDFLNIDKKRHAMILLLACEGVVNANRRRDKSTYWPSSLAYLNI